MTEPSMIAAIKLLATKIGPSLIEPTKGLAISTKQKLEVRFSRGFEEYLSVQTTRYSKVKTIISSNTPVSLLDVYVNLFLFNGQAAARDDDFLSNMGKHRAILFTATAGSGKSMLMRYLFLRFIEVQSDRIPIFIDLRELNHSSSSSVVDLLAQRVNDAIPSFTPKHFIYALTTGKVILFLDGFDEVDYDKRPSREVEINKLVHKYPKLWIFVSSRPAEDFASWSSFNVFKVQPFTRKQVDLLVSKLAYDEDSKNIFRRRLAEGLYDTHQEFLTNPLLTIMMLITIAQSGEVPAKIHLFYEYAFEALFGRHDVTKEGGFERKKHTNLALDDFKRLFSYFCMISYLRKCYDFSEGAALEIIAKSISASQIAVDKDSYRKDLTETTCMLVRDGLDYTFSHRSFQEYFVAYFMSRVKTDKYDKFMPLILSHGSFDNVIQMLFEMNQEKFEEDWALPNLENLKIALESQNPRQDIIRYVKSIYKSSRAIFSDHGGVKTIQLQTKARDRDHLQTIRFALYNIYNIFPRIHAHLKPQHVHDEPVFEQLMNRAILPDDKRFDEIRRKSKAGEVVRRSDTIDLNDSDNSWFLKTHYAQFAQSEVEVIPVVYEEIKLRVDERHRGMSSIIDDDLI